MAAKRRKQFANFLSGGLAGTISSTLTAPLEVVKTQLQSSTIKNRIDSPVNHLLSAFAAGITSNTIMNPLWMVKTRFQIMADTSLGQRAFSNYGEVVRAVFREEGPMGFFKGLSASYIGCFEGGIQWVLYEKMKLFLQNSKVGPATIPLHAATGPTSTTTTSHATARATTLSAVEYFFIAAGSKFLAILATYPHEVVRTRLREQAANGAFKYSGFFRTLTTIAREEGRRGLYRGMDIHLLRSVPNAAIMFLSFELVNSWLEKHPYFLSSESLQFPKLSDIVPTIRSTFRKDSIVAVLVEVSTIFENRTRTLSSSKQHGTPRVPNGVEESSGLGSGSHKCIQKLTIWYPYKEEKETTCVLECYSYYASKLSTLRRMLFSRSMRLRSSNQASSEVVVIRCPLTEFSNLPLLAACDRRCIHQSNAKVAPSYSGVDHNKVALCSSHSRIAVDSDIPHKCSTVIGRSGIITKCFPDAMTKRCDYALPRL
eukprot:gene31102-40447_t